MPGQRWEPSNTRQTRVQCSVSAARKPCRKPIILHACGARTHPDVVHAGTHAQQRQQLLAACRDGGWRVWGVPVRETMRLATGAANGCLGLLAPHAARHTTKKSVQQTRGSVYSTPQPRELLAAQQVAPCALSPEAHRSSADRVCSPAPRLSSCCSTSAALRPLSSLLVGRSEAGARAAAAGARANSRARQATASGAQRRAQLDRAPHVAGVACMLSTVTKYGRAPTGRSAPPERASSPAQRAAPLAGFLHIRSPAAAPGPGRAAVAATACRATPSCKLRRTARRAACDGTTGCCGLASTGQWDAMGALQVARDTSVRAAALSGSWAANHRACSHFRHPAAVVAACCGSPGLPCYSSLNSCSAGCGQAGAPPANTRQRATEGRCRRHAAAACRPARVERARSGTQAALLRATAWSTTGPWVWRRALCKGRHGRTRQRPLPRRLRDLLLRVVVRHIRNGDWLRAGALKRDIPPVNAGGGQAVSEDRAAHMGRGTNGALEGGRLTARCRPGPAHLMTTPASKRTGPLTVRLVAALRLGATLTRRSSLSTSL